jgi:hypothetical protein
MQIRAGMPGRKAGRVVDVRAAVADPGTHVYGSRTSAGRGVLDGGVVITVQSAASAVLVAALSLSGAADGTDRMLDALIGGSAGLLVAAALPGNPLTVARGHAARVLGRLAGVLRDVAGAGRPPAGGGDVGGRGPRRAAGRGPRGRGARWRDGARVTVAPPRPGH